MRTLTSPAGVGAENMNRIRILSAVDAGCQAGLTMAMPRARRRHRSRPAVHVLILDEPTTGVDPEQRVTLRAVLAELARTSIVVLSTHQTEDVAALCERVIVLDRGRIRYDGPVTELGERAAGPVCLADAPDPGATVSWRTGTGRYRNVAAQARDGVEHVEPSLED